MTWFLPYQAPFFLFQTHYLLAMVLGTVMSKEYGFYSWPYQCVFALQILFGIQSGMDYGPYGRRRG
jgi:hypothetical protein